MPGPMSSPTAAANPSTNATIVGPIGENLEAASVSVTLATDEETIAVAQTGALPAGANTIGGVNIASPALGQANMAGSLPVAIASNQSNVPENLAQVGGAAVALGQTTMAASIPVAIASNQTAVPASQSGTWTVQPGNTPNTTPWLVQQVPQTTNGVSNARLNSASAATGTVKASAGSLKGMALYNSNAAVRYLQIYNKASAPTLSTDTPVFTFPIPPTSGVVLDIVDGDPQGTGIAYAITTDNVAIPTTGGAAGDVQGTILYV